MAKPISIFKNEEQFMEYAKMWQHYLFLDNWFVQYNLVLEPPYTDEGDVLWGVCAYNYCNSSAEISVFNGKELDGEKNCAEVTLVHELLHLRPEYIFSNPLVSGIENKYLEANIHQALESMSKSLVMARYNLDTDFFNGGMAIYGKTTAEKAKK